MRFERLRTSGDGRYAWAMERYRESFPPHEQRAAGDQAAVMGHEEYRFQLILDREAPVGILLCWETEDFLYVEHFCIDPALRGRRYGQQALELLGREGKTVILEIDPPVDEISRRRQSFYQRAGYQVNGFAHIHPPYRQGRDGHRLVVLSWPRPLTQAGYDSFARYLRETVMGERGRGEV